VTCLCHSDGVCLLSNRRRVLMYSLHGVQFSKSCLGSGGCHRTFCPEPRVRSRPSPCEVCGRQSDIGTDFSPYISVFPCQCHSASTPDSFNINLLRTTGRSLRSFNRSNAFPISGALDGRVRESCCLSVLHGTLIVAALV